MRLTPLATTLLVLAGCGNEYHPEYHPQSAYSYVQDVSMTPTSFEVSGNAMAPGTPATEGAPPAAPSAPQSRPTPVANGDPSKVVVLPTKDINRPCEVIGVVDVHVPMGNHDTALDQLRRRAASMGADAVIGVDFNHPEEPGQPSHLSGLAVRYVQPVASTVER